MQRPNSVDGKVGSGSPAMANEKKKEEKKKGKKRCPSEGEGGVSNGFSSSEGDAHIGATLTREAVLVRRRGARAFKHRNNSL